jgi:hypothetical protein
MSIQNNICEGCPAAFALGIHAEELASQDGGFMIDARRDETKKARCALEIAAGQTACSIISKQLPELPEAVPLPGSNELIEFVSQCPSFPKYMELRMAEVNQ